MSPSLAGKGRVQFQGHRVKGHGIPKSGRVTGRRKTLGVWYFVAQKVSKPPGRAHLCRFSVAQR